MADFPGNAWTWCPSSRAGLAESPRFFGRRRGKRLRVAGRDRFARILPALAIAPPPPGSRIDPASLFPRRPGEVWLEIGFGGGEHLAWQAARHPEIGIIGCEVFVNGIASLLGHVEAQGLDNVRVFPEDARLLMPALPDGGIGRAFVLFPDPWPKKRHIERRFVGPDNLDQLARLLAPGAELRIATDDPTYQKWAREQMARHPDFQDLTGEATAKPDDWPATRYEEKALAAGRQPHYLVYRRR
ncbi:MAG TPA: tRNA (guanosine(46)-N7)-methyltransferase TrmB [Rhodospirillaceae bacterium]|nr:tRNA (guanosine(46)-N7)-methyltransferase TrmB [Rhodospirillaceae bacterium]